MYVDWLKLCNYHVEANPEDSRAEKLYVCWPKFEKVSPLLFFKLSRLPCLLARLILKSSLNLAIVTMMGLVSSHVLVIY